VKSSINQFHNSPRYSIHSYSHYIPMTDSKLFAREKLQTLRTELTSNSTGKKKIIKQKSTALKKIVANMTVSILFGL
jgi:hypothetical protein